MKKYIVLIAIVFCAFSYGQTPILQGAQMETKSTTEINAISSPLEGRLEYDSTIHNLKHYNGSTWLSFGTSAFADLTGSARDNADLDAELDLKADVTSLSGYLLKSGGSMSGDITMSNNDINNVGIIGSTHYRAVPTDTPPASAKGNFYFDDSESTLKQYNGTAWEALNAGGGTDDQTAAEVSVTASGFDGNLDTGDDTVQKVAQKLDDLVIDAGGGIVAQGFYDITSASGTSTFTITHGLGYTPSIARIGINIYRTDSETAIVNSPIIYNVTSTTFDVIVSNTGATTVMLSWRIFGATSETPLDFGEIATGLDTELGSSDWRTGGGSMTAAQVKDSLLANTNTNILTDAEQTKLGYITLSDDVDLDAWAYEIAEISGKIGSDTFGRTNATSIDDIYEQPHADYISDGAPASGKVVIIPDAPPSATFTGTVIPLDGYYTIDNTSTDTATWTLNATVRNGAAFDILIDMASEPSITGATQIPGTQAFSTNTLSVIKGTVIQGTVYYYFLDLE